MSLMKPFITRIDFKSGKIYGLVPTRRPLSDLRGLTSDEQALENLIKYENSLVYEVYSLELAKSADHITMHATVIQPGKIGNEFFFTRGHRHIYPTAEIYIGLNGQGLVLLRNQNETHVISLNAGDVVYIPPGWAHRAVNIGPVPLVFLSFHRSDAGHDYDIVQQTGFGKRIFAMDDGYCVKDE